MLMVSEVNTTILLTVKVLGHDHSFYQLIQSYNSRICRKSVLISDFNTRTQSTLTVVKHCSLTGHTALSTAPILV